MKLLIFVLLIVLFGMVFHLYDFKNYLDTKTHNEIVTRNNLRERKTNQQINNLNRKPMIAICAATHSKSNWYSLNDTSLKTLLIPSIERTLSSFDRSKYNFRLYLSADHDDIFWIKNQYNIKTPDWLPVYINFYDVPKQKIPFNPMMQMAYNDGAEYMIRINDDSEFISSDWLSKAINKLASYNPPNVGTVGPNCLEGNTNILTHDMVHRTHLDIFENYYPDVFSAWWVDDWISKVYGVNRTTKIMNWRMKHHIHKHGIRYEVQHHEKSLLKGELEKGQKRIQMWLKNGNNSNNLKWQVVVTVSSGFIDMFENWLYYFQRLHIGNVTLIAEDRVVRETYRNRFGVDTIDGIFVEEGKAHDYKTKGYLQMVSKRARYLLDVLKTHKRIIYTDIDTIWLSDPRPYFSGNNDLWLQVDAIHNERNYYCTGFFAMVYSDTVIQLMEDWDNNLRKKTQLNQPIFNTLIWNSDVKHQGLDRIKFPSGKLYFDEGRREGVVIVHNNYIEGYDKKIKRFKTVGLWREYIK